jgi:adenosylcobyric acid synthase
MQTDHCIGTYIHGFLDNAPVIEYILKDHGDGSHDRSEAGDQENCPRDLAAFKNEQYDKLAAHVRKHVDMERIYQILTSND